MNVQLDVPHVFVDSLTSATEKVVGVSLENSEKKIEVVNPRDVNIQSKGAFRSNMHFRLDPAFEQAVLKGMHCKDGVSSELKELYIGEFINILSGHALTMINNVVGETSRLTVPIVGDANVEVNSQYPNQCEVYFTSPCGSMLLEVTYEV